MEWNNNRGICHQTNHWHENRNNTPIYSALRKRKRVPHLVLEAPYQRHDNYIDYVRDNAHVRAQEPTPLPW